MSRHRRSQPVLGAKGLSPLALKPPAEEEEDSMQPPPIRRGGRERSSGLSRSAAMDFATLNLAQLADVVDDDDDDQNTARNSDGEENEESTQTFKGPPPTLTRQRSSAMNLEGLFKPPPGSAGTKSSQPTGPTPMTSLFTKPQISKMSTRDVDEPPPLRRGGASPLATAAPQNRSRSGYDIRGQASQGSPGAFTLAVPSLRNSGATDADDEPPMITRGGRSSAQRVRSDGSGHDPGKLSPKSSLRVPLNFRERETESGDYSAPLDDEQEVLIQMLGGAQDSARSMPSRAGDAPGLELRRSTSIADRSISGSRAHSREPSPQRSQRGQSREPLFATHRDGDSPGRGYTAQEVSELMAYVSQHGSPSRSGSVKSTNKKFGRTEDEESGGMVQTLLTYLWKGNRGAETTSTGLVPRHAVVFNVRGDEFVIPERALRCKKTTYEYSILRQYLDISIGKKAPVIDDEESGEKVPVPVDTFGRIVLYRDPKVFSYICQYLSNSEEAVQEMAKCDAPTITKILLEMDYFGVHGVRDRLRPLFEEKVRIQQEERINPPAKVITINVGGRLFNANHLVLCCNEGSRLARDVTAYMRMTHQREKKTGSMTTRATVKDSTFLIDGEGHLFYDRNPDHFNALLSYLRDDSIEAVYRKISEAQSSILELATFFEIHDLVSLIQSRQFISEFLKSFGDRAQCGMNAILPMNVGGERIDVSWKTLTKVNGSKLHALALGDIRVLDVQADENGRIFLDRRPDLFRIVVDYLRGYDLHRRIDDSWNLIQDVMSEADFYGLSALKASAKRIQDQVLAKQNHMQQSATMGMAQQQTQAPGSALPPRQTPQVVDDPEARALNVALGLNTSGPNLASLGSARSGREQQQGLGAAAQFGYTFGKPGTTGKGGYPPQSGNYKTPVNQIMNAFGAARGSKGGTSAGQMTGPKKTISQEELNRVVNSQNLRSGLSNVDFSQLSFRGLRLKGANMRSSVLTNCDLCDCDLQQSDMCAVDLRGSQCNATSFRKCIMQGSNCAGLDMTGCTLIDADMKGANLSNVVMTKCRLRSLDLEKADLTGWKVVDSPEMQMMSFRNQDLTDVNIVNADLSEADFLQAQFSNVVIKNCNLEGSSFKGADMRGLMLTETTSFSGAVFDETDLSGRHFSKADFSGCRFVDAEMLEVIFNECFFEGTDFKGCRLLKAKFSLCTAFTGANFTGAELAGVRFEDADFSGCSFHRADVRRAQFLNCTFAPAEPLKPGMDARRAIFANAKMEGADFSGSVWEQQ
eukprot:Clim_evm53s243 gene=Clim_evmTU53s243